MLGTKNSDPNGALTTGSASSRLDNPARLPQDAHPDLAPAEHVGRCEIARGLFISPDKQREIQFVKVSGVSMVGFSSPRLKPEEIADVLSMVKANGLKRVMIADTVPTPQMAYLIGELCKAGVSVHFRDHHADSYYGDRKEAAIQIAGHLGDRCTMFERSRAPTIMSMITERELVNRRFDLYIAAPVDPDATCGFLNGVGLNPQRVTEKDEMSAAYALGLYDSPRDQPRCNAEAVKAFPLWLETMSQLRAVVDTSAAKLCDSIAAFARCIASKDAQLSDSVILRLYTQAEQRISFVKNLLLSRRAGIAPILEVDATIKTHDAPQSVTDTPLRVEDLKLASRSMPKTSPNVIFKLITTDARGTKIAVYETNGWFKDLNLLSLIAESRNGHVFHSGSRLSVPATEADLVDRKLMSIHRARVP